MRPTILNLEESRIREVANAGMGRADVLAFWFGESDEVTPEPVRAAAIASLEAGETFYSHNLGLPELRAALADYSSRLHGVIEAGRMAVTSGGVNALMLAMQMLIDADDKVLVLAPVWPNLTAQPQILGARLLVLNSPNSPTGWKLTRVEQQAILARCRQTGSWTLADEVYERLYYRDDTAHGLPPGRRAASGQAHLSGGRSNAFRGESSARHPSWTSPRPTTGWWWRKAFPSPF